VPVYDSYARLSWNPNTRELEKIETQLADNSRVIDRMGGTLGEPLSDGLSAWKRGVRRPGWERLLERVESGESDGIVVWHTDRLFRQPRDLERLIDLGEKGFTVASAHGARDLASPEDRFILRIEVAQAAKESDDKSRRVKRRFETLRANGQKTGGPRLFGFPGDVVLSQRENDRLAEQGKPRPVVPPEQVEAERQALRDGSAALLEGASYMEIAREWNEAGLRTAWGRTWVSAGVRDVLIRGCNAGILEHHGVEVGALAGEPIVDRDVFDRVRALVLGRRRGRAYGERYVGTGFLRCGRCDALLSAHPHGKLANGEPRRVYFCNTQRRGCGKIAAQVNHVDERLEEFVVERLSDPEHAAGLSAFRARTNEQLERVRAEIEQVEQLQAALTARLVRREIPLAAFDENNALLVKDLARLTAERGALPGGNGDDDTIAVMDAEEVLAEYKAADLVGRRTMLKRALGRNRLFIDPAKPGRTFDPNRIRLGPPPSHRG
jgi:site-specific DNA recombinase